VRQAPTARPCSAPPVAIRWRYPTRATVGPDHQRLGDHEGTKHLNAAKLFMEYLDSIERPRSTPITSPSAASEVPSPPGAKPISEIKTIRPSVAEIDKGIPDVIEPVAGYIWKLRNAFNESIARF